MVSMLERLLGLSLFVFYIAVALGIVCLVAEALKALSSRKHRRGPKKTS